MRRPPRPFSAVAVALAVAVAVALALAAGPLAGSAAAKDKIRSPDKPPKKPVSFAQKPPKDPDSCKRITGVMKVRILALRGSGPAPTSAVARGVQSAVTPIFGGSGHGADPAAQRAADIKFLEDSNKRLAEKNCPSFDLAAALAPGATDSPRATIVPAGKPIKSKPAATAKAPPAPPAPPAKQ